MATSVATSSAVKTSPEKLHAAPMPGKLARDTGDKEEVHTSEEELGVTTPREPREPRGEKGKVS